MSFINVIVRSLFVLLLFAPPVLAASVTLVPTGNATYSVQGADLDGVNGIQLAITYNAASLTTPTVTQGGVVSGAMFAANASIPGRISIAVVSTKSFSGSGQIAAITFVAKSASPPIPTITSNLTIDSTGATVASTITPSSDSTGQSGSSDSSILPGSSNTTISTNGTNTTSTPTTTGIISAGTVTIPTEQQQRTDAKPAAATPPPQSPVEPAAEVAKSIEQASPPADKPAAETKTEDTAQYVVYKSVLDRFRLYKGSKSLPAILALFDGTVAQTIRQEPSIVLSDGMGKALLTVDIPARIVTAPSFAVNGGTLVSFRKDKQIAGRWSVEVLPEAGAVKVIMSIIAGAEEFDYPLTVAPPVKTALTRDETGWKRFLQEIGTPTAPLHDFNGDGVRNYIDEYIFAANILATPKAAVKPAAAK